MNYRDRLLAELATRCPRLKTKAAYLGLPDPDEAENPFDTAVWWCERTAEPLGPDGGCADPRACGRPGRSCYEAPRSPA